jgi:hypothetical protein
MGAKVDAAISAIGGGVQAVIIAPGGERDVIDDIIAGMHLHLNLHQDHISHTTFTLLYCRPLTSPPIGLTSHTFSSLLSSSHLPSYWIDFSHLLFPSIVLSPPLLLD